MSKALSRQQRYRFSLRELMLMIAVVALTIPSLMYASEAWLALVAAVTMLVLFVMLIAAILDRRERQSFAIGFAIVMVTYGLILTICRAREFDQWKGRLPTTQVLRSIHAAVNRSDWSPTVPVLQSGATGKLVEVLQLVLNARLTPSPNLEVDGDFGPLTDRAVNRFQSQAGLGTNGIVDIHTWKQLGLDFDARRGQVTLPVPTPGSGSILKIGSGGFPIAGGGTFREIPPREFFMPIGHCWWALLLGYCGGRVARFLYCRRLGD